MRGWSRQLLFVPILAIALLGGCSRDVSPPDAQPAATLDSARPEIQEQGRVAGGATERIDGGAESKRFALVFGNGAYRHGDALAAPPRDAALMASALQARGYHVLVGIDRDLDGMREDIAAFEAMSRDAELRLLYFAGHGFEFDNANYLMPVDLPRNLAALGPQEVRNNALRLDQLVWALEEESPVFVAVIDACRVPPSRGASKLPGLTAQAPSEGTILAYATSPGRLATDSLRAYGVDQEHSPYTYYLASALLSPEVTRWDQAFLAAYNVVNQQTRGAQQPWMNARVNRFPAVGALQSATQAGSRPWIALDVSPERRAAGQYWAREDHASLRMAADRTNTNAELERWVAEGDSRAAIALARRWVDEGEGESRAVALLQPFAEQGHAVAQLDLGTYLYTIAGEDSKERDARYWWVQASSQGIGEARAKLAMLDGDPTRGLEEFARGMIEQHEAFAPSTGDAP